MIPRTHYFVALLFAALAFVPTGAHLAELMNKMPLDATAYLTVQQIYRGWALFGVVVFGALGSTLLLLIRLRAEPTARRFAAAALACLVATQVIFWSTTFPVNRMTANWTMLPGNWMELRARWEYSHAAAAVFNLAALVALLASLLRLSALASRRTTR